MLKRIALSTAALAVFATSVFADATSDFKKFYMAAIPDMVKAFKNKDINFFKKNSTDDFTMEMKVEGKMNKAQAMAGLKQWMDMMKTIEYTCKPLKFGVNGDKAMVRVEEKMSGEMMPMGDKKKHTMSSVGWYDQYLTKKNGKWLMAKIVETKTSKMMMDGKPFDPSKMAPPPQAKAAKG